MDLDTRQPLRDPFSGLDGLLQCVRRLRLLGLPQGRLVGLPRLGRKRLRLPPDLFRRVVLPRLLESRLEPNERAHKGRRGAKRRLDQGRNGDLLRHRKVDCFPRNRVVLRRGRSNVAVGELEHSHLRAVGE